MFFICFEDYYSKETEVDDIKFTVVGKFTNEKQSFMVYDSSNNTSELSNLS